MEPIVIKPQPGKQELFLSSEADIAIYGGAAGSGKTFGLLLEGVRNKDVPGFTGVILRRSMPEIKNPGGLWDEAGKLYPLLGGVPYNSSPLHYTFPGGARISFQHLQYEATLRAYHGAQIPFIGFDELQLFSERQFFYMLSRNRTTLPLRPYVRGTCNADADSWLREFLTWWIGEDGYAIEERAGVIRWFVRVDDKLIWGNNREELDDVCRIYKVEPLSVTFVPALLSDNSILETNDPGYRAKLQAQTMVDRERLLGANWNVRFSSGSLFKEHWLEIVDVQLPRTCRRVRYWDKAATAGVNAKDYTAGVLLAEYNGIIYVEHVFRDHLTPNKRNEAIKFYAEKDRSSYDNVELWIEQEPGSGGKESALFSIQQLRQYGAEAETHKANKVARAKPMSIQAEYGLVKVIRGSWNADYIKELAAFPTKGIPDDQVDASSGAFAKLALTEPVEVYH